MSSTDRVIDEAARRTHGLVTYPQLRAAGLTEQAVRHRCRAGRLVAVQVGVYRTFGVPASWEQRMLASCLAAGPSSVASHRAAAALWDLGPKGAMAEITVPLARCPVPRGTVLHRSTDLADHHVTVRHGVPVTNPLRTLVDLGAVVADRTLAESVELAVVRRLVTIAGLRQVLDEVARQGRRGAGSLRRVLDRRALRTQRSQSMLESFFARLVKQFGLEGVRYQHRVVVAGKARYLDYAIPDALLGIEIDGDEFHGSLPARRADRIRQNGLATVDYLVLRYGPDEIRRTPRRVLDEIATVAERRRVLLCRSSAS